MDGDDFHPLTTDENGTFAKYVPGGFWYVEIADFTAEDSNVTEIYRGVLDLNVTVYDITCNTDSNGSNNAVTRKVDWCKHNIYQNNRSKQ